VAGTVSVNALLFFPSFLILSLSSCQGNMNCHKAMTVEMRRFVVEQGKDGAALIASFPFFFPPPFPPIVAERREERSLRPRGG